MISLITSSYKEDLFKKLETSIAETIGVPYEIIQVWNPGLMGICQAYNQGAAKATYDYLIFVHEDVQFKTANWGYRVINYLKRIDIGAVGIAGATYKSSFPSSWSNVPYGYKSINVTQARLVNGKETDSYHNLVKRTQKDAEEVVVLDGVFIACRKEVWESNPFDQSTFKGFHGYDIDFTLAVAQHYKLLVLFDIDIVHYSEGNPDKHWMDAAFALSDKWRKKLPYYNNTSISIENLHRYAFKRFVKKLKSLGYSNIFIAKKIIKYGFNRQQPFVVSYQIFKELIRNIIKP